MSLKSLLSLSTLLMAASASSDAASILVINQGVSGNVGVTSAVSHLTSLGHTVSTGGTLANYSAFDQVWDLRYQTNFVLGDLTAFSSYLASGGRVFFIGENPTFDTTRNVSLRGTIFALGGGDVAYGSGTASNTQTFTAAGAALNTPNTLSSVNYSGARQLTSGGSGFLVTASPDSTGSMVAWNFGQIAGARDARMIALWDIDVFRATSGNGIGWTENMVNYLGAAPAVTSVPEPSTSLLVGGSLLLASMVLRKRYRR